jgi:protein tyrosine phosphatase
MCDEPGVKSNMFKSLSEKLQMEMLTNALVNEYDEMKKKDKEERTIQPKENFICKHPPYRKTNSDFFQHSLCTKGFFYDASRIPPRNDNPFGLDHPIIACSAPYPNTLFAFWAMVYQNSVRTSEGNKALIAMVTNLNEAKNDMEKGCVLKDKATQYWPYNINDTMIYKSTEQEFNGARIQSIEVTLVSEKIISEYPKRYDIDPFIFERTIHVIVIYQYCNNKYDKIIVVFL